jgi:hypothetical protein
MGFPGTTTGLASGWSSYSADGDAERFHDDGQGTSLLVTIDAPNAPPQLEPVEIGRLRWIAEQRDVTGHPLGTIISDYSRRANPELTLLRLTLSGVIDPQGYARLDELRQIVQNRFHAGSTLDADQVLIEPKAHQLAEVVGAGVLQRVLDRLRTDVHSPDATAKRVAQHALKILYQLAWEEQPA